MKSKKSLLRKKTKLDRDMRGIYQELFISSIAEKIYEVLTIQVELTSWWTPKTFSKAEENFVLKILSWPRLITENENRKINFCGV